MKDSLYLCTDSITLDVAVRSLPKANILGSSEVKKGNNVLYETNVQYVLIEWKVSGGIIQGSNTNNVVNVLWGNTGKGSVKIIVSDLSSDCKDSATLDVNINSSDLSILGVKSVCEKQITEYSAAIPEGRSSYWTVLKGGAIKGKNDSSSVSIQWGSSGSGEIMLVQTILQTNIKDSANLSIVIHPLPPTVISGLDSVEVNKIEKYSADSDTSYENVWSAVNGAIQGFNNLSEVSILWYSPGSGLVKLTRNNKIDGCSDSGSFEVIVAPANSVEFIALQDNLLISPNPANDYIEISITVGARHALPEVIRIYNVFGEEIPPRLTASGTPQEGELRSSSSHYSILTTQYSTKIDISSLPPGIYFVRVGDRAGKFVKI